MRPFPCLNRVAFGILGRWHPSVLTLLAQQPRTSSKISDAVRRALSIALPSHRMCALSQRLCVRRRLASQIMCVRNWALLRVKPFIIARRYSYEPFLAQDLVISATATCYQRERWVTPDGRTILAPLPEGIDGHFGPELRRFVLMQYHQSQSTLP